MVTKRGKEHSAFGVAAAHALVPFLVHFEQRILK